MSKPLPGTGRTAIPVRAGTSISIPVRDGINIEPDLWGDDASGFKPERWFAKGVAENGVGPNGVLTFGDGLVNFCIACGHLFELTDGFQSKSLSRTQLR